MDQRAAFAKTLEIARERGHDMSDFDIEEVNMAHLESMQERMTPEFSEAKLGRWLGYIQGVLVAVGCITLEEAKAINQEFSDNPNPEA